MTNFRNATFQERADFESTTFQGWVDFGGVTFQERANFESTTFQEADFISAIFQEANFRNATFQERVIFWGATFQERANFNGATFQETDFWGATFQERVIFVGATFKDEFLFIDIKGIPLFDFRFTRFSESTIMRNVKLNKALFNLSRAELVDSTGVQYPQKIYEEILLERDELNKEEKRYRPENWEEVSTIYRKLKQAHQRYGDYEKAGDFYYREMECKRKSYREEKNGGGILTYLWLWLLNILCGYGERVKRIVGCSASIILGSSLFYYLFGFHRIMPGTSEGYELIKFTSLSVEAIEEWLYAIYYSIVTFTSLGYGDMRPIGYSHLVASIEVILGVFFMALFVVVFVRKMSR